MFEINNVSYTISDTGKKIFEGLNLTVPANETVTIIGLSGSGKTTFLKIAAGLTEPTTGSVNIDGFNFTKANKNQKYKIRQRMGFMFQDIALISNLNVYDNIALPLRYHTGLSEKEIFDKIDNWINMADLQKNIYCLPPELNISQKKIVALIRAIIYSPKYLFLDEPTSNLDFYHKDIIKQILEQIKNNKTTIVMTTNNLKWATELTDRFVVLADGKIAVCGKYENICLAPNAKEIIKNIGGGE
ncbi:MAG: ATP-binding cassette domain-containing protein [Elusimicrobiota bacterium]